jgi:hypothetical protein
MTGESFRLHPGSENGMAKTVVIDELHLTLRVPSELAERQLTAIHRILNDDAFLNRLRRAVLAVIRATPELAVLRVSLTR